MFMIKRSLLVIFCILILNVKVSADDLGTPKSSKDSSTAQEEMLIKKIQYHRKTIYDSLELTSEQAVEIDKLDKKFFTQIEPDLKKLTVLTNKLQDIANSNNCTKKSVNEVKKEFKAVEKDMNSVKNDYEKELKIVLTREQKSKYNLARKQKRAELQKEMKQEMKKEIEKQRNLQKQNSVS